MNKAQLQKNVGVRVRLRPQATEALGAHDDDWTVRKVSDETLELVNERTAHIATLGLDAVKTYTSDPARDAGGVKYGFLSLTVSVKLLNGGKTDIEPLPFGRGEIPPPALKPLIVSDRAGPRGRSSRAAARFLERRQAGQTGCAAIAKRVVDDGFCSQKDLGKNLHPNVGTTWEQNPPKTG